jgi:pimeloyl-ACP methyl ester carboxylesterase
MTVRRWFLAFFLIPAIWLAALTLPAPGQKVTGGGVPIITTQAEPPPAVEVRMYGMTGLAGKLLGFSLGVYDVMREVAAKHPTVRTYERTHWQWRAVLATAEANYKIDGKPIILIGHSLGANAAVRIATRLLDKGIPVAAVFAYDPTPLVLCVPRNVQAAIGWQRTWWFQLGGGNLEPCNDFAGAIEKHNTDRQVENVDVPGGHVWVDDAPQVHRLTMKHVGEVLHMLAEIRKGKQADNDNHDPMSIFSTKIAVGFQ